MKSPGSNPNQGPSAGADASRSRVQDRRDIIDKALNPTAAMLRAEELLNDYYARRERDARDLGYQGKVDEVMINLGYKQPREYRTVLEAVAAGWAPKTLDAAELIAIHGEIDAVIYGLVSMTRDLSAPDGVGSPVS